MRTLMLYTAIILSGCATVKIDETSSVISKTGFIPTIGSKSTSSVGGVIFSQFSYLSKTGYRIEDGATIGVGLGRIVVSDGDFLVKAQLDGKTIFCTEKPAYIDPLMGPQAAACFIDADDDGRFESVKYRPGAVWFGKNIDTLLEYSKTESISPHKDSFKYELLYQGISKNTLKLSYREYKDDFARVAFFQDVTYDLGSTPATISFRSASIEVFEANNNQISYRVLSGF